MVDNYNHFIYSKNCLGYQLLTLILPNLQVSSRTCPDASRKMGSAMRGSTGDRSVAPGKEFGRWDGFGATQDENSLELLSIAQ